MSFSYTPESGGLSMTVIQDKPVSRYGARDAKYINTKPDGTQKNRKLRIKADLKPFLGVMPDPPFPL
jgi:hypothetical protein